MIREHIFNSRWLGQPAGIVDDPAFFQLEPSEQARLLARFHWVEYRGQPVDLAERRAIHKAGFVFCSTEIPFRIRLSEIKNCLQIGPCAEAKLTRFGASRYQMLSAELLDQRFQMWGNTLMQEHPETCLTVLHDGRPQGYFLSKPEDGGLFLALACLAEGSVISGADLYKAALSHYHSMGFSMGWASFSSANTSVLNIYASLGARFLSPVEHYFFVGAALTSPAA